MCKARLDTKIHPQPSWGCKVRGRSGVIIDPAADAGFGETRGRRGGEAGGCEYRGDSGVHQPEPKERASGATRKLKPKAKPEDEARGATRSIIGRRSRMSGVSGQPEIQALEAPKDERFGVTRRSVAGTAGRWGNRGDPGNSSTGVTRKCDAVGQPAADAPEAL